MKTSEIFLDALVSAGKAPELADIDNLFEFLIGSWVLKAILHDPSGQTQTRNGELHAAWVLEGRAIQDLFIFPRRADRTAGRRGQGDRYATTIRTFDRMQQAWRVDFINPAAPETNAQLMARRRGEDIEMEGKLVDGTLIHWYYRSITPRSFHYSAERLVIDGELWELYLELFGTRAEI